jgi:hypothetical protein
VGADAQKAQLKDLKQSDGTGADDNRFNVLFRHTKLDPLAWSNRRGL